MGAYADAGSYYLEQLKPPVPGQKEMRAGDKMYVFDGDNWQYAGKYQSARESIKMSLRYAGWTDEQVDDMLDTIRQGQE